MSPFPIRKLGGPKTVGWYIPSAKTKQNSVNQEFYIRQNCPSKMREKLRYFQVLKSWGRMLPLDLPYMGSPSGWNKKKLDSNLKYMKK